MNTMLHKLYTHFVAATMLAVVSFTSHAQGVITTPRTPSPASSVSQTIGISTVTVKYSRPSVKGREIWGALVPYGWNADKTFGAGNSAPWRAGANENTTIELSHPAKVEGHMVPAGTYGLFFVINKDNTGEVVLSKDYKLWGSFWYDAKNDEMRAPITLRTIPHTELLTYDFIDMTKTSAELVLNWEKKQFPVKIEFDVDKIVMENAENELKNTVGFSWQGYMSAANYAAQNNVNLDQALQWINQSITQNKNFTNLRVKSAIQQQMNNTTDANATMQEAMAFATENEINQYGYQLLQQKNFDKAIEIFTLNTKKYPNSANTFDSLGEAYFMKGDKKSATTNFKKSLTLNPSDGTKANSEKYLKQMGTM